MASISLRNTEVLGDALVVQGSSTELETRVGSPRTTAPGTQEPDGHHPELPHTGERWAHIKTGRAGRVVKAPGPGDTHVLLAFHDGPRGLRLQTEWRRFSQFERISPWLGGRDE